MKKPNYKKFVEINCEKRGLKCVVTNDEFDYGYKIYLGFKNASLEDIQQFGSIQYVVKTENIWRYVSKFLYENQLIMISKN